jgi:hypothetical protein
MAISSASGGTRRLTEWRAGYDSQRGPPITYKEFVWGEAATQFCNGMHPTANGIGFIREACFNFAVRCGG